MKDSKEDNNLTVVKHNQMIEARYSMSIMEQRILLFLISQLDFENQNVTQVQIATADLINFFEISNQGNSFKSIRNACENLMSCKIDLSTTDDVHLINVFGEIDHKKGSGIINASFYHKILPYLFALKSHFTKYKLSAVAKFKSEYSIRIYELLKMHEYQASNNHFFKVVEINNFRKMLGVTDKYRNFNNFETDVLIRATKEINERSDILITYEKIRKGKIISEIKFNCQSKVFINNVRLNNDLIIDLNEKQDEARQNLIKEFELLDIRKAVYDKWFKNYDLNVIKNNFAYTMKEYALKKIKNITGYMNKALEYNYWNASELEKIAQKIRDEEVYQTRLQKELEEEQEKEAEKQNERKAVELFKSLTQKEQRQLMETIFIDYPHLKNYYQTSGLNGHMPYFLYLTMKKFNIIN